MSITTEFTHDVEDGIETYSFPTVIHPQFRHCIDRVDDGPWGLSIISPIYPISAEVALTFKAEVEALCEFMAKLAPIELRRHTEPGEPEFAGVGGGL